MKGILDNKRKTDEDIYSSDAYNTALGYAERMRQPGTTLPTPTMNVNGIPVQRDVNYTEAGILAAQRGDIPGAMLNERMHNEKDGYYGLGYGASGIFNYIDPKGYGGLLEGKRNEIENYFDKGFSYNYEEDPEYLAMRRLKEKEADKAYKDGYAQLSRAFDGDIPVNMINKLLATKGEVIDQADSYIPALRQAAYDMYLGKGNALLSEYNMLGKEAADDYNRWLTDRQYITNGIAENIRAQEKANELERLYINDAYERAYKDEERDYKRYWEENDREYKRNKDAEDAAFQKWKAEQELAIKRKNANKSKSKSTTPSGVNLDALFK